MTILGKRVFLAGLLGLGVVAGSVAAHAQGAVNVYTNREPGLYSATLEEFTKATGIKVNALFSEQGLAERIAAEGERSPADVLITVDIGRLKQALDLGLSQPLRSEVIAANVPAQFRDPDNRWVGLSLRARTLYTAKDRVQADTITYEDLTLPKWKGRICTRSFQHPYNLALVSAMLVKHGEAKTKTWLEGVKANLARKPSGGDRDVAKDISAGVCDIGLGNHYYIGLMMNGKSADQRAWAEAIKVVLPRFENGGTHINLSGALVTKHAPNRDNAIKLVEYMTSSAAQSVLANVNYEYPVRDGVAANPLVAAFGPLKADTMAMSDVADARGRASALIDEVGFDR